MGGVGVREWDAAAEGATLAGLARLALDGPLPPARWLRCRPPNRLLCFPPRPHLLNPPFAHNCHPTLEAARQEQELAPPCFLP